MADALSLEIINEHLPYEIDMLRFTYLQLVRVSTARPQTETNEQQTLLFSFLESFCVHARSLLDFFSNTPGHHTDAIASQFTDGYAHIDPSVEPLKTIRKKINKQIFHLTTERTLVETEKFNGKDAADVLRVIEPAVTSFVSCLTSEFEHFKCNTSPVVLLSVLEFSSATSAIHSITGPVYPFS
jgi:hypothetical protein